MVMRRSNPYATTLKLIRDDGFSQEGHIFSDRRAGNNLTTSPK